MKAVLFALLTASVPNFSLAPEFVARNEVLHSFDELRVSGSVYVLPSWAMGNSVNSADHSLANLPSDLEIVIISYAKPSSHYILGQHEWRGSGLNFSASFDVVRNAVTILKMKNPRVKVLLGVGGPTYLNWKEIRPRSIASLVSDLGLDGVDINYQPLGIGMPNADMVRMVRAFRDQLPRPLILSATVWPFVDVWSNALMELGGHFDQLHIPTAEGVDSSQVLLSCQEIYRGPLFWSRNYSW